jgi:hypothetical protein
MAVSVGPTGPLTALYENAGRVTARFQRWSTASKFAAIASVVVGMCMAASAYWVSGRIEAGVVHHTAGTLALYMEAFIEPYKNELETRRQLSQESIASLDAALKQEKIRRRIIGVKIWATDGTIIYSTWHQLMGRTFPPSDELKGAIAGEIVAELNHLDKDENEIERSLQTALLEVYAPVRSAGGQRVVAVAEVYEIADELVANIRYAQLESIMVFGFLGLTMVASLSSFVSRASRTISQQQDVLSARVQELSELLAQNRELQRRVVQANRRSAETNEQVLNRVSAELHDGPAQLIGLGLLRLDEVTAQLPPDHKGGEAIRSSLAEALREIRTICAGLALPELEGASVAEILDLAISNHERRSKTSVAIDLPSGLPEQVSTDVTICLFRFVQESLNNAFRQSQGRGQSVRATFDNDHLAVTVADEGPGFDPAARSRGSGKLGLALMRSRVEALGGELTVDSAPGAGTRLTVRFHVSKLG